MGSVFQFKNKKDDSPIGIATIDTKEIPLNNIKTTITQIEESIATAERKIKTATDIVANLKGTVEYHDKFCQQVSNYLEQQKDFLIEYTETNNYNFALLQCHIEREMLMQEMENEKAHLKLMVYLSSPWYHKISKRIMNEKYKDCEIKAFEQYKNKIEKTNAKLILLVKEQREKTERREQSQQEQEQ